MNFKSIRSKTLLFSVVISSCLGSVFAQNEGLGNVTRDQRTTRNPQPFYGESFSGMRTTENIE